MTHISRDDLLKQILDAWSQGQVGSVAELADLMGTSVDNVTQAFTDYGPQLAARVSATPASDMSRVSMPESLGNAFASVWQQAVDEAYNQLSYERKHGDVDAEENIRLLEDELKAARNRIDQMEAEAREYESRFGDAEVLIKSLEAEAKTLKASIISETNQRKHEEKARSNVENDLAHLRKTHEELKRTLEKRIKEEQTNSLDAISRAEADVRYYRGALEKVRDESGKKESALTRNIHDLQAEVAKKDVKIESVTTHMRSLEKELKAIKQNQTTSTREGVKVNNQLLSESNKNKRLEEKIQVLTEELRMSQQKTNVITTEASRRENSLRNQNIEKDEELLRLRARYSANEKRLVAQEHEIRRLTDKLKAHN
ncbi:MAG: hypothetical protein ACPGMR_13130 [Pontibacterium sp.]